MTQPLKDAIGICKTIMRNGYDAYVINAKLQTLALQAGKEAEVDISTELDKKELQRLFPTVQDASDPEVLGLLREAGVIFRFYSANVSDGAYPELCFARLTPRLVEVLRDAGEMPAHLACPYIPKASEVYEGFAGLSEGEIRLLGIPDETLKQNYLLAIRAIRFAANFQLPIESNTWVAILRNARRVLDYVSISDIMDEWRKVEAENLWHFVRLLYDCMILHGLVPELTMLRRLKHVKNPEAGEEDVFKHTLEVMRRYPEELPFDWQGTIACLFHDIGKLYTAEFSEDRWTFYQHHRVGAKVTRKILNRLGFAPDEIDLICHLVRHHMRFHFMLNDKGIRRFKALDEYPRLMEIARADIKARDGSYREFNHNLKMLERTETPEEMLEPLLNGHEIMDFTGIKAGPMVGVIRQALLQAQVAGDVTSVPEAVDFVRQYADNALPK